VILNKVRLSDFISHKNTELDFGYGINVVVGPNGAGKTSILDAISFALFSDYSNRGRKENLINSRANRCKATVEFTEGGIKYAVEWSMERNKSAKGSLYRMQNGDRTLLAQGGGTAIVPEVEKILGIDKSMFLQSIYVRQGEIEELVMAKPADRKELISRLLGLEDLERAWENIKYVIDRYKSISDTLQGELTQRSTIEIEQEKYIATSQELVRSLSSKRKELSKVEKQITNLRTILEQLKKDKKQFDKLDKEKGILEKDIEADREKLHKEEAELNSAVKAEEAIKSLESEVSKLPFLEDCSRFLSQKREQELQLERLKEKLANFERLEKTLEENQKEHDFYLERKKLQTEKGNERKKLEGADVELKRALNQFQDLEKEEQKKSKELEKELTKCTKILEEQITVDNVEIVFESKKKDFLNLADQLEKKVDEYNKKIGMLEHRQEELGGNLSKLEPSEAGLKACPTCETELSPDRLAYLINKFSSEKEQIKTDLENSAKELDAITQEKRQVDGKIKKIASVEPEKIKDVAGELAQTRERLATQQLEVEELTKKACELKKLDEELTRLQTQLGELEEPYMKFESAKRESAKLQSREQIEAEMAPILGVLDSIGKSLKDSVSKIGYEPQNLENELTALREKKQQYDSNLHLAKRKAEYETNVTTINQELTNKEQKLDNLIGAIEKLDYDEEEHSQKQAELDSQIQEESELNTNIAGMEAEKKAADTEATACEKKLEALKDKEREKKVVDDFVRLLGKIRAAYGKDGVQKMIRARARPLLERSTRDIFERFNLAYSDIKIDDDYNIAVIGPSGEEDIDQISGGERVALAIALRLAIAQVLSGRVETIIMDEPTTHLDEERRKELVNILSSFFREGGRIIPQMLIITHHREIEDVADVIYTIRKEEGYSIAESGAPLK
jgi:exonuclease SbcC